MRSPLDQGHLLGRSLSLPLLAMLACEPSSVVEEAAQAGWGWEGRLVEEVAIGTEARGEEDLLGHVMGIDATVDRIFVADGIYTMVRVYDWAGNHVMNMGRHGGGPGEFYSVTDLGIDPVREQVVVREGTGILHRFSLSGEYVGTVNPRLAGGLYGSELLLRVTRDGVPLVRHTSVRIDPDAHPPAHFTVALFTVDSTGAVTDSVDMPMHEEDEFSLRAHTGEGSYKPVSVPFGPRDIWSVTWDGAIIWGNSSEYRFEVRYADGRKAVYERQADPVEVQDAEWKAAAGTCRSI